MLNKALRLADRLPWHYAVVRQVLSHRSEISLEEARFLGTLIHRAPVNRPIVEIGTLFGESTRVIALFKAPETILMTVDSFRWNPFGLSRSQHREITRENLEDGMLKYNVALVDQDKDHF